MLIADAASGQLTLLPAGLSPRILLLAVLRASALVLAATAGLAALYLIKSALGIDLLAGPSPLHNLLYPLLGRG